MNTMIHIKLTLALHYHRYFFFIFASSLSWWLCFNITLLNSRNSLGNKILYIQGAFMLNSPKEFKK